MLCSEPRGDKLLSKATEIVIYNDIWLARSVGFITSYKDHKTWILLIYNNNL